MGGRGLDVFRALGQAHVRSMSIPLDLHERHGHSTNRSDWRGAYLLGSRSDPPTFGQYPPYLVLVFPLLKVTYPPYRLAVSQVPTGPSRGYRKHWPPPSPSSGLPHRIFWKRSSFVTVNSPERRMLNLPARHIAELHSSGKVLDRGLVLECHDHHGSPS
jgi:hypothetical protein